MGHSRTTAATLRTERRAAVALCAVFALLVQLLAPGFAAAAPRLPDGSLLICADGGMKAPTGVPAPPAADDHPCDHCVCPTPSLAPPAPTASATVAYAAHAAAPASSRNFLIPQARVPPRPPGQGPPASDA